MKLDVQQMFGIIIMIVGSYLISSGLIGDSISFATVGFILFGFAVFLWSAEILVDTNTSEKEEL